MEIIKILTGFGEALDSRMWFSDLRINTFRLLAVQRRPDCPVCAGASAALASAEGNGHGGEDDG
jgi:hypothetical protein